MYPGQGGSSSSAYKCLELPACLGDGPADPLQLGVGGRDTQVPCPSHHSSSPCPSPGTAVPTSPTPACKSGLCCWSVMETERLLVAEPVCDVSLCEKCLLHPVLLIERNTDPWCQFFLWVAWLVLILAPSEIRSPVLLRVSVLVSRGSGVLSTSRAQASGAPDAKTLWRGCCLGIQFSYCLRSWEGSPSLASLMDPSSRSSGHVFRGHSGKVGPSSLCGPGIPSSSPSQGSWTWLRQGSTVETGGPYVLVQPVEPLPTAVFSPHLRIAFLSNITASSCTSPRRKAALGECAHGGAPRQAPGRVGAAAHSPA